MVAAHVNANSGFEDGKVAKKKYVEIEMVWKMRWGRIFWRIRSGSKNQ